jgi:hypothetical protein
MGHPAMNGAQNFLGEMSYVSIGVSDQRLSGE